MRAHPAVLAQCFQRQSRVFSPVCARIRQHMRVDLPANPRHGFDSGVSDARQPRPAPKARPKALLLGSLRQGKKHHLLPLRLPRRARRPAIDARRPYRVDKFPIRAAITSLHRVPTQTTAGLRGTFSASPVCSPTHQLFHGFLKGRLLSLSKLEYPLLALNIRCDHRTNVVQFCVAKFRP